jgi:hypothetical protein
MSGIPGLLIQPLVTVKWGDTDLTQYPVGQGLEPVVYGVTVQIPEKDNVPTCELSFAPTPPGFAAFQKCVTDDKDKPVIVTMGYLSGSQLKMKFFFTGLTFSTGIETSARVFLTVATKGAWTDNRISFTMTEKDKVTLDAFVSTELPKRLGDAGKDIKVELAGQLKEDAPKIEVQLNVIQQTPMQIVEGLARALGFVISNGDTMLEGSPIVLSYPPNYEPEKTADKPIVLGKQGEPKPAERKVYVLGPGLVETFDREMKFTTSISGFDIGKSFKEPGSFDSDSKDILDTKTDAGKKKAEGTNAKGTTGNAGGKTPAQRGVKKSADAEKEARAKKEQIGNIKASTEFFMVPYVVGIKPRDFIAIPSLKLPCDYVEDWVVEQVTYAQTDDGGVRVGVDCTREFIGTQNMMDTDPVDEVKKIADANHALGTSGWHGMYWAA